MIKNQNIETLTDQGSKNSMIIVYVCI